MLFGIKPPPSGYTTGCHTIFHHRYHIVWVPKYRYKVLRGKIRGRIRTIVRQVCKEMGVTIVSGVLSTDHVHSVPRSGSIQDGKATCCR